MPDAVYLSTTTSTCRECARLIPAQIWLEHGAVFFHKHCPEHGPQRARIYGDAQQYLDLRRFHRAGSIPHKFQTEMTSPCPGSCGLCLRHEQHVCMPILEITDHCDMACPVCLVKTPGTFHLDRAQVGRILDGLIASEGQIDVLNLSGGEPTTNPAFREIVEECTSRPEILYVSVSTNGARLSRDGDLLRFLADRHVIISLQFDGTSETCNLAMRGRRMLDEKLRLIDAVEQAGGRMSLTLTAARGLNDGELTAPIRLLFARDHILSVMIQPMAYIGTGSGMPRPDDALTIPDITRMLAEQCPQLVRAADFSPLPCSHPACFSLAFYLRVSDDSREFLPVRQLLDTDRYLDLVQNRALPGTDLESFAQIKDALYDLWSGPAGLAPDSTRAMQAIRRILDSINSCGRFCATSAARAAEKSMKSIFIHHFMDRHNFDVARVRKCCQVYPLPDGRLMPACVYNCLRR